MLGKPISGHSTMPKYKIFRGLHPWTPTGALPLDLAGVLKAPPDPQLQMPLTQNSVKFWARSAPEYYIETLIKELWINSLDEINSTYAPSIDSYDKILKSHSDFVKSMGLKLSEAGQDLPYLYWTPKLHKTPFKHRFIAGSSKCKTKELSCLPTKILTTIKDRLNRYCNTKMSHN